MNFTKLFKTKADLPNRVNVGCGPNARKGWVNVDIQNFNSVDQVMDVTKKWDFKNLEYIYAEHFIEHLEIDRGIDFLVNAGRSLTKGGWIRLSTPNLEWVVKTHYKFHLMDNPSEAFKGVTAINRAFYGWGHKFIYSQWMLEQILLEIGYKNITFCEYGNSQLEVFKGIEEHSGYIIGAGYPSVIVVEAQKDEVVAKPKKLLKKLHKDFLRHANAEG